MKPKLNLNMRIIGFQIRKFITGFIMTRPSDFLMNSDYLSIAQTDKTEYTITIGSGSVSTTDSMTQDFVFKSESGAISRFMIRSGTNDFSIGNELTVKLAWDANNKVIGLVRVYRIDNSICRFSLDYQNLNADPSSNPSNYPEMSYTIKIVSFKSPNTF